MATDCNANICTDDTRNRPIGLHGDSSVEILLADDDRYLAAVQDVEEFIACLAKHRYTPNDVWSRCNPAMWAVWCDIAWRAPELAEYCSDGDRGVA